MHWRNFARSVRRVSTRGWRLAVLCLFAMLVNSCAAFYVCPITGRKSLQLVPEGKLNGMGADAYTQTLSEAKETSNAELRAMVERVGKKIARVVDAQLAADGRAPFDWQFKVIEADTVNAWCMPGGKVAFYTGIIPICQDETGIAVVMGHEVAHAYAGHGNNRMSNGMVVQYGIGAIAAAMTGASTEANDEATPAEANEDASEGDVPAEGSPGYLNQLALQALGLGSQLGSLAFGRGDESHADHLGLLFMAKAGYDPSAAVPFWTRMKELSGGEAPPEILSTHPSNDTRIANLKELLPAAIAEYEKQKNGS